MPKPRPLQLGSRTKSNTVADTGAGLFLEAERHSEVPKHPRLQPCNLTPKQTTLPRGDSQAPPGKAEEPSMQKQ